MTLTKDYLIAHGWRESEPVIYKDFIDWKGEKYRIGWSPESKVLYMGFGQAPCKVETLLDLCSILDAFEFYVEARNLME